jgi:DNA-binding response OmpR family regulator
MQAVVFHAKPPPRKGSLRLIYSPFTDAARCMRLLSSMASTILVIEDDAAIRRGVLDALKFAGHTTLETGDGDVGLKLALSAHFDLILLDLVLPHASGFDILKALRRERPGTPVIILSARGEENDRVRGLRLGADDYVVKPFSVRELLARVEAVLRRAPERQPVSETLTLGTATIDFGQSCASFEKGGRVELSERERDVLRYLALNRGRPVSRDELLQRVWHLDGRQTETRTVDMHIANLRHKLRDDADAPHLILTLRGKGYQLA